MKKLLIILTVAILAVACRGNEGVVKTHHDITFDVRQYIQGLGYVNYTSALIAMFDDLEFDLESSSSSFKYNFSMISGYDTIAPKHINGFFRNEPAMPQIEILGIEQGVHFVAVIVENLAGQTWLGYRVITIDRQASRNVQRLYFEFPSPQNVFIGL